MIPDLKMCSINYFAKILAEGDSNEIIFHNGSKFISSEKLFDPPIRNIRELNIKVIDNFGNLMTFIGGNYSLTLEIIELQ